MTLMLFLYLFFSTLIVLTLSPLLAAAAIADWRGMRDRLGIGLGNDDQDDRSLIWFHAASVGEVVGLARIVNTLLTASPARRTLVTTMTMTGLERARQLIPEASFHHLAPLDTPFVVHRFIRRFRPTALILVEGELWPALVRGADRAGCPIALVNARMSDRSYPRNRFIRPLLRSLLQRVDLLGAQTALDAERFVTFGAEPAKVVVTGNVKFDSATLGSTEERAIIRNRLGIAADRVVLLAGCPRPVFEERAVLEACLRVHTAHPDTLVIWAPRHLDRLPDVQRMLTDAGLTFVLRSHLTGVTPVTEPMILLDTMGELSALYRIADVAFVGATLVPLGGHNVFEPAVFGVPVVFGPHTENVRAAAEALLRFGAGTVVTNGSELAAAWLRLIENPEERRQMGQAAHQATRSDDGALARTMALLDELFSCRVP